MIRTHCGTQLPDNTWFRSNCGMAIGPTMGAIAAPPASSGAAVAPSAQAPAASALQPNLAGLLCYLVGFVTGIFFLVAEPCKHDGFVRFHAFQSIFVSVAWIVVHLALGMLMSVLPWSLWRLVALVSELVSLAFFLLILFVMYKAYNTERFKLPVIGDLAEKQV